MHCPRARQRRIGVERKYDGESELRSRATPVTGADLDDFVDGTMETFEEVYLGMRGNDPDL